MLFSHISLLTLIALLASLCVAAATTAQQAAWKPAASPLVTPWTKDVTPDFARPDYPRPNAVRKDWKSLNGLWEFAFDDQNQGRAGGWSSGKALPDRILVPWTYEAALSGIGKGAEIHERVWYRRTFLAPRSWTGRRTLLHFGAVDWESTVWVNGVEMGTHRGGYAPITYDITAALKPSGAQEVVVSVYDPADPKKGAFQPKGKQLGSESIWYTRTTGIWQSVWLEPVNATYITDFTVLTDLDGTLIVHSRLKGRGRITYTVTASRGSKALTTGSVTGGVGEATIAQRVPDALPWTPERPALYDVTLRVMQNGALVDEIKTYCAFRTVGMQNGRITLNGKPYFIRAVLDQGYWPDGILTPPTDRAIKNDVEMTKAFGFNMARKHVKVEDPRWYYWCDKLGLLVAQDMPSSHNLVTDEAKANFKAEWTEVMAHVRNHPCIVLWVPFNENWGDPKEFQDVIVEHTRSIDPSRPIIDASGWTQRSKTDIIDIHDYGNDLKKHIVESPSKPRWIGEYGGVALPVEGHTWVTGWGYQTVKTPGELLAKYKFLTDQIYGAPGLSGYCYTQLTDVEQELNGVMTYDRIPKAPPERFAEINGGGVK